MKIVYLFILLNFFGLVAQQADFKSDLRGKVLSCEYKMYKVNDKILSVSPTYHWLCKYNPNQSVNEIIFYKNDKTQSNAVYEYNSTGQLESVETLLQDGKIDKATLYIYDEQGHLSDEKKFNGLNNLESQFTYIYNNNILTNKITHLVTINQTIKETYKYNPQQLLSETVKEQANGSVNRETFFYDDQAQLLKKTTYNAQNEVFTTVLYEYNTQGDKINLFHFDADHKLTTDEFYEYMYDAEGNWTKKTNYEKGVKVSEETRKIVYY